MLSMQLKDYQLDINLPQAIVGPSGFALRM